MSSVVCNRGDVFEDSMLVILFLLGGIANDNG